MRYIRGFRKGWKNSAFDSGFLLGTALPIFFSLLLLFGCITGLYFCFKKEPGTCVDYSYKDGMFGSGSLSCNKWPNMRRKIEERWVKADIVHCYCTEDSFPKSTK